MSAQKASRIEVPGLVTAPSGQDVQGISIYNMSSRQGVITDVGGAFTLRVAENDRVLVSAIQFSRFVVVIDKSVVEEGRMRIYLNPSVTELEEVVLKAHDLTGHIKTDISQVKVVDFDARLAATYKDMEFGYEFAPDHQSGVENHALPADFGPGIDFLGLALAGVAKLVMLLTDYDGERAPELYGRELMEHNLSRVTGVYDRIDKDFFSHQLGIPEDDIKAFLLTVVESRPPASLFEENNDLLLMEYLEEKARQYLQE